MSKGNETMDIAIIGMSGKYGSTNDINDFWNKLQKGESCIGKIPKSRWNYNDFCSTDDAENYCQYGSFINDLDLFNPLLFDISPRDAEMLDPQIRKMLEITWYVLEDAGYSKKKISSDVGIFIGNIYNEYQMLENDLIKKGLIASTTQYSIANRISNYFNFKGASMVVNTACSSSLTAIHLAINSIRNGECKYAIAGGVNLQLNPGRFMGLNEIGIISKEPFSAPFGEENGFILGEGIGVVLLKLLEEAEKDNDNIYGVIKASICKHSGGACNYGETDIESIRDTLQELFQKNNLETNKIDYIESAANGVNAGDVMEYNLYKEIFKDNNNLPIGSIKSNLGNIEAAAGVAQLTKVLLQFKHNKIVPSINANPLNKKIVSDNSIYVQNELISWNRNDRNRQALISSFGVGGTNAFLIVEEYNKEKEVNINNEMNYVIPISAYDEHSLNVFCKNINEFIKFNDNLSINDIAYSLQTGHEYLRQRLSFVVKDKDELIDKLSKYLKNDISDDLYLNRLSNNYKKKVISAEEIDNYIAKDDIKSLAKDWVFGAEIDFEYYNKYECGNKIPLVVSEIRGKKYWVENAAIANKKLNSSKYKSNVNANSVKFYIISLLSSFLKLDVEDIEDDINIKSYGLDSILAMKLINTINQQLDIQLSIHQIIEQKTINDIYELLKSEYNIKDEDIKNIVNSSEDNKVSWEGDEIPSEILQNAISDLLLKKVINGELSPEKVAEIEELLY